MFCGDRNAKVELQKQRTRCVCVSRDPVTSLFLRLMQSEMVTIGVYCREQHQQPQTYVFAPSQIHTKLAILIFFSYYFLYYNWYLIFDVFVFEWSTHLWGYCYCDGLCFVLSMPFTTHFHTHSLTTFAKDCAVGAVAFVAVLDVCCAVYRVAHVLEYVIRSGPSYIANVADSLWICRCTSRVYMQHRHTGT